MPREAKVGGGVWHEYILLLKKKKKVNGIQYTPPAGASKLLLNSVGLLNHWLAAGEQAVTELQCHSAAVQSGLNFP